MQIADDFLRAIAYLERTRRPAYLSFVERASAHGLGGDWDVTRRIVVRSSDGAIVHGTPPDAHVVRTNAGDSNNPFDKREFFDPDCYVPESEEQAQWNGQATLRFRLKSSCANENGITDLYVESLTLRPLAVDGTVVDNENHVTTFVELRYTLKDQYVLPSSMRAHASGRGWLFWVREHAEVDYTDYEVYSDANVMRRQETKP